MLRILLLFSLFFFTSLKAGETIEVELNSGTSFSLKQFHGEGKTLFIWLPSERGMGEGYYPVALDLAALDYDVWVANLHENYIIPIGRDSLDEVAMDDMLALLDLAQSHGFEEVYLISTSRSAELALNMAYLWQQQNSYIRLIRGVLMFSPHLVSGRTELGQDASFVDISAFSNLPVYVILPEYSTKFARGMEIAKQLRKGGSMVFTQVLPKTQGGFHMRPVEDLKPADLAMRDRLAQILETSVALLRQVGFNPVLPGYRYVEKSDSGLDKTLKAAQLHPYVGNKKPQKLILNKLSGKTFNLEDTPGQVVLVNFWATWCRPCVEEIPSLSRLVDRMKDRPFKVVAVNIGESSADIEQFVKLIPVNFDILLDRDGDAVRDWKVYAYPSNFLIDRDGHIQYAYRGALEWDEPSIVKTIETLF